MTLILKPIGRGNWKKAELTVTGDHIAMLLILVGQRITLAGAVFRVCEVRP